MDYHFEDFTESVYRQVLRSARENWAFISFPEHLKHGRVCLWRHDVDMSLNRALRLAEIESEEGVKSTYFILLHSYFYHPLEPQASELIMKIKTLGHHFGLHFDPQYYQKLGGGLVDREAMKRFLRLERDLLQTVFDVPIPVFSLHNPSLEDSGIVENTLEGMINTYGDAIRHGFAYCSDSNGYWRFERLTDVVRVGTTERLHVLTHPEWWTPEVVSPSQRVHRCVEGRAAWAWKEYVTQMGQQMDRSHVE